MKLEIYFRDLNKKAQKAFLEAHSIKSPKEANWDTFPLFVEEV